MALGHEHGVSHIQEGETVSQEPIDTILWIHIFIMMLAFGVIFPVGMVLGVSHLTSISDTSANRVRDC